jgi:hypothetical protein
MDDGANSVRGHGQLAEVPPRAEFGEVPIRDFVPSFVERGARARLRQMVHPMDPALPVPAAGLAAPPTSPAPVRTFRISEMRLVWDTIARRLVAPAG